MKISLVKLVALCGFVLVRHQFARCSRRQPGRQMPAYSAFALLLLNYFPKGSSKELLCKVNHFAPSGVMYMSSSRRTPNSPCK